MVGTIEKTLEHLIRKVTSIMKMLMIKDFQSGEMLLGNSIILGEGTDMRMKEEGDLYLMMICHMNKEQGLQ